MGDAEYQSLHNYYSQRGFKPTFASLTTSEALDRYEAGRVALYRDLLGLPCSVFAGAHVCEYGPDTGENALIFARWGARLTLVEPNPAAWPDIRAYFKQFGLEGHLDRIAGDSVETFRTTEPIDIINAEGFIYTVQPSDLWLKQFKTQLAPQGLIVANYLERSGCMFELLWSLFHSRYGSLVGRRDCETAFDLFEAKWNSIPHTRRFESWVQDVLENPFVRLKYLIEPEDLLASATAAGLKFHTSWPRYDDPFYPFWHKRIPDQATLAARRNRFIARSRISFALARPLFFVGAGEAVLTVNRAVTDLVSAIDGLIDGWAQPLLDLAKSSLSVLDSALASPEVMADPENRAEATGLLKSLRRAFELLDAGAPAAIRQFASTDTGLISAWGSTTHYVVLEHA